VLPAWGAAVPQGSWWSNTVNEWDISFWDINITEPLDAQWTLDAFLQEAALRVQDVRKQNLSNS
jgi:hypothetical protein